ncbi:DUF748 domain-containing protein [Mangrovibacterium marinum]|uniref:AsmA family protein n=1 Tax=Mangrovibacterium marinum TaxID=1639118 RepID=UPI002A18891D|nr:DUF748 domain-containing protein [Mangrovibacterium marinum]
MKKRYYVAGGLLLIVAALLFFLSSMVKNYLVKNSPGLTGRKLAIKELHFNYWKAAVSAEGVVLYEKNQVDSFIAFQSLTVDFSPWKLLHREYSFSQISLVEPQLSIEQYADGYNFSDLIPEDDSLAVAENTSDQLIRFSLYNLKMTGGKIRLYDQTVENRITVSNLDFSLPLIAWDNHQSTVGAGFHLGEQGTVQVNALVDQQKQCYTVDLSTTDVQIKPVSNYLTDYFDVSSIRGLLTSDIHISGSLADLMNVQITGWGKLSNASVIDGQGETLLSVPEIRSRIKELDLKNYAFNFSSIEIDQPALAVTRGKEQTNVEQFFAPLLAEDTTQLVQLTMEKGDQQTTSYRVDTLKVNRGSLRFADHTLNRTCTIDLTELNVELQNLSDSSTRMPISFNTKINKSGRFSGQTMVNMQDPFDFYLDGKLQNVDLVSFSPYSEYYIASPFTQGWFSYAIRVKMANGKLQNENDIHVGELEFGKKTGDKPYVKVPVRLALYVMKDAKDNIDINMPVSGSTDDPKFKLGKIIWGAFVNVLSKAALSPFKAMAGLVGTDPEKMEYLNLAYLQDTLENDQLKTLASLAQIMQKKPDLLVTFIQRTNEELEKEKLAVKLAKANYMAEQNVVDLPTDDDSKFRQFLNAKLPAADSLDVEVACSKYIPDNQLNQAFVELLQQRNRMISDYFAEQQIPAGNIYVGVADLENLPDEIRRPEFKVEVSLK